MVRFKIWENISLKNINHSLQLYLALGKVGRKKWIPQMNESFYKSLFKNEVALFRKLQKQFWI